MRVVKMGKWSDGVYGLTAEQGDNDEDDRVISRSKVWPKM